MFPLLQSNVLPTSLTRTPAAPDRLPLQSTAFSQHLFDHPLTCLVQTRIRIRLLPPFTPHPHPFFLALYAQ